MKALRIILPVAALAAGTLYLLSRSGRDTVAPPPLPTFPLETMEPAVRTQFVAAVSDAEAEPRDAAPAGALGMLFHAYGFYANAETCYRRAIAIDAEPSPWRPYLARTLLERGAWDEAAAEFTRVIETGGDEPITRFYLAEADRQRHQLERALNGYATAGGITQALCGAGRVHAERGELDRAAVLLARAIAAAPDYGTAHYALGQVLRREGRLDEARAVLALAEKHRDREPPLPDPLMQRVAQLRRGAVDALHRAIDLLRAGDVARATALLEESVRTDPGLVEAHSQLGAAHLSAGDLDRAEASLRRAVELETDFADAWYNLGVIAHRRGEHGEAVACFERVLSLRPRHAEACLGLGTDLPEVGRGADAVEPLRRFIEIRPMDARGYKRLAAVLAALGRYPEAIAALRSGMDRLSGDASIAYRLAWGLATCPDPGLRDAAEAERLARAAVAATGGDVPQPLDTLAAALAAAGRFPEAIATATRARDLAGRSGRSELAAAIDGRIAEYRAGRAHVEPAVAQPAP